MHKYFIVALPVYWIAIFTATHIRHIPDWMVNNKMSDMTLHFLCYFVLTFLFWTALSPGQKVNWKKLKPWIVTLIILGYGVFDEFSQGFVGRGVELKDYIGDFLATVTGMTILTIFSFWWAALVYTCLGIFIVTNLSHVSTIGRNILVNSAYHLLSYMLLTILWLQCTSKPIERSTNKTLWLLKAVSFPISYLLIVKGLTLFSEKTVYAVDFYTAITGIILTVIVSFIANYFTQRISHKQD